MSYAYPVLGHVIDARAESDRVAGSHIRMLLDSTAAVPAAVDWSGLTSIVLDQERSESCVWHGAAMALYLRGRYELAMGLGPGVAMPSMMQGWTLAQWKAQELRGVEPNERRAINVGSAIAPGLMCWVESGIASAEAWPLDRRLLWSASEAEAASAVFDMPIDVDQKASVAKLRGNYGAYSSDFPLVARAALAQGHFPIQAFDVCEQFLALDSTNPEYRGTEGRRIIGRHLMVLDGFKPGWLRYRGSYNVGWGDGGWIWVKDEYAASPQARDGAVFTFAPAVAS